jgi:hypothetical protein
MNLKKNQKYGNESYMKTEDFKEKTEKTNIERYGFANVSKSDIIKQKQIEINLKKYNQKYYFKTNDFKEKSIKTLMNKYGVDCILKSPENRKKINETNLKNMVLLMY